MYFLLNQEKKDTVYMVSVNHGYFGLHFNTFVVLFTPLYKYFKKPQVFE